MIPPSSRPSTDIRDLLRMVLRQKFVIIVPVALGIAAAWLIHGQLTPRYESQASVVLNVRTTNVVNVNEVLSGLPREQAAVRTEIDVLRSRAIAQQVVDKLGLAERPDMLERHLVEQPLSRLIDTAKAWLARWVDIVQGRPPVVVASELPEELDPQILIDIVQGGVAVANDGLSYTLDLRFVSPDPELATEIANAYADAYLAYQIDIKLRATRDASRWLATRLDELRQRLEDSDRTIGEFRRTIGIIDERGQSTAAAELAQLRQRSLDVEARQRELESRLATVRNATRSGDFQAVPEILASSVIGGLRQQAASVRSQETAALARLGQRHPEYLALKGNREAIEREIAAEATRIATALSREADSVTAELASLRTALQTAKGGYDAAVGAELRVKQLEREAAADRELYENYLLRLKQLDEQEQLQTSDAWIISRAQVPWIPTYPRRLAILLLGAFAGGAVGAALAFLRERLDDSLRSAADVEALTGLPVLGLLPTARRARPDRQLLRRPHSPFAEAVRSAGIAVSLVERARAPRVIAVTSSVPREGKTTMCMSMARQLAADGRRILLIDADLRRPRVMALMADGHDPDLADVLADRVDPEQAIRKDPASGADYIGARRGVAAARPLLESSAMQRLLEHARQSYDVVIVDTPPVTVAADAALVARHADVSLFCIRWGSTPRDVVLQGLRLMTLCRIPIAGILFTRVDVKRQSSYAHYQLLPPLGDYRMATVGHDRSGDEGARF